MTLAVGAAAVAVSSLGGDSENDARRCRTWMGAEACVIARGHAYRIEGKGFVPSDDVAIHLGGQDPFFVRADAEGRIPGGGRVAGVLPGDRPSLVIVRGNGASGEAVYIELEVCGTSAAGRRVC